MDLFLNNDVLPLSCTQTDVRCLSISSLAITFHPYLSNLACIEMAVGACMHCRSCRRRGDAGWISRGWRLRGQVRLEEPCSPSEQEQGSFLKSCCRPVLRVCERSIWYRCVKHRRCVGRSVDTNHTYFNDCALSKMAALCPCRSHTETVRRRCSRWAGPRPLSGPSKCNGRGYVYGTSLLV